MYKGLMFQNQLLTSRLCRWIYRGIHVHHLVLIKSQFNSICISSNLFQVCWIKASSYWMGQPLRIDVVYIWAIVSHNPHNHVRRNEKVQVTKGMSFTKVWLQISVIRWPVKFVQYLFNYNNEYLPQHDTFFRQSRQKSCQRHLKCCQSGGIFHRISRHTASNDRYEG